MQAFSSPQEYKNDIFSLFIRPGLVSKKFNIPRRIEFYGICI
jgi:hypothetical protein